MVSHCYPPAKGRFPRVTHPSATRVSVSKLTDTPVRLACIRHAASVSPEPGSNSPKKVYFLTLRKLTFAGSFITRLIVCLQIQNRYLDCILTLFSFQGSLPLQATFISVPAPDNKVNRQSYVFCIIFKNSICKTYFNPQNTWSPK